MIYIDPTMLLLQLSDEGLFAQLRSTQRKLVESQFKPDLKRVLELVLLTLIIFALYGWFAVLFRSTLLNNPRALLTMQRGFAAAFVLIAIQLVLSALT